MTAGLAYGVALWLVAAGFVVPVWLNAVAGMGAPVPNLEPTSLAGHLLYGGVLGVVYAVPRRPSPP